MTDLATRKAALAQDLADTTSALLALVEPLTADRWELRTATTDGWTIRDTVGHLVSGEQGNLLIARGIRAGSPMYRPDFDLARYNRRNVEKALGKTGADHLAALAEARAETLAFLDDCTADDLDREGQRTTGEPTTVAGVLQRIADHYREHTEEIKAALGDG